MKDRADFLHDSFLHLFLSNALQLPGWRPSLQSVSFSHCFHKYQEPALNLGSWQSCACICSSSLGRCKWFPPWARESLGLPSLPFPAAFPRPPAPGIRRQRRKAKARGRYLYVCCFKGALWLSFVDAISWHLVFSLLRSGILWLHGGVTNPSRGVSRVQGRLCGCVVSHALDAGDVGRI